MGIHFNPANNNIGPMMDVASKKMALAKSVNQASVSGAGNVDSTSFSNKAYFNSYDNNYMFELAGVKPPSADVQARTAGFVSSITETDIPML